MIATLFLIAIGLPATAFAYLDPGAGSIIFQSLIGALVTGGYLIKLYWAKLRQWGKQLFDAKTEETQTSSHPENDPRQ